MTYEENGRTFLGCDIAAMGMVLEGVGADVIGVNCSLGPDRMLPALQRLAAHTSLPLALKLNAGLPDPQTGEYSISPEAYVKLLEPYLELPVAFLGGCCGTSPAYIRAIKNTYASRSVKHFCHTPVSRVPHLFEKLLCSVSNVNALLSLVLLVRLKIYKAFLLIFNFIFIFFA